MQTTRLNKFHFIPNIKSPFKIWDLILLSCYLKQTVYDLYMKKYNLPAGSLNL
jgi:hypothetical protein